MDYQLVVIRGRSGATALKLQDGVTTAGRQDDCHLRIKSSQVSRKHCELFEKHGMLLVKDLNSSNGTFVNGKKIDGQRVMEPGDELMIGPIAFRVEKIGQPSPAKPAPAEKKAGDTAIVEAAAVTDADAAVPADDDFEIDFDETPSGFSEGGDLAFEIDLDDALAAPPSPASEPASAPEGKPAPGLAASTKPSPPKAKEPEPVKEEPVADDAIADFLSGIKLDDD